MNEWNGREVLSVREGGGLSGGDGRGDGWGNTSGKGKAAEVSASRGPGQIEEPEVEARPKRRRFSAAYKVRVIEEAEGCTESGEIGALLRREGLYSSQLSTWREQYRAGALQALRDDKRGRKTTKHPLEDEVTRLRKHNERLARRLEQAEAIIEIQKKVAAMLGIPLNSVESEEGE